MSKHIVIIGGGFAGINLAKKLGKVSSYKVTLVDKNNYNFFPPLLYQVSTGYLDPSSITFPFRNLFRGQVNLRFRMGTFEEVKPEEQKIILNNGELTYDYLVLATGTQTNYFGLDQIEKHAIPMKTLEDALDMRNLLLQRLEQATRIDDTSQRLPYLNMVIAGGGPTGVEISGVFAELRNHTIRKEFPELIGSGSRIYLINGGGELLSPMSEKSQKYTLEQLQSMGVEVLLNTRVVDFDGEKVLMKDGSHIYSKNLIWATGVTGFRFKGIPDTSYVRGNRLKVDEVNRIEGLKNVYAIGDSSLSVSDPKFPTGHPQLAQVAMQQGRVLAKNFKRMVKNKPLKPFTYLDKGSMAIIGSNKAVADMPKPKMHFKGFMAWFIWLFVHLFALIDYRNRVRTFYNWSTEYLTKNQDLRLIIRPSRKKL
ncbi:MULTISPECIES: NAD(P)/FAD-dependent oxidoreductase [Leeuwenhoekiella]|jgi:NADH dehydrogenase|uniref:NADH:ubiquinone reductase (non-electrogenic) n=1 Tax=Leeuwenhoekiella blandensis (strain CECT 7118 / CCUG 51940 / KCTC 22103 / MED217) TaxID=398720 RepID=A3XJG2_LEEBM|nr:MULTISPECIES: NAD(P)/FAD-dependent oxidoreductase [Leeuwenhoekiella]EAQ50307.1 putative NADH dehydrogenase [Leeuwenhoekiella blandensis MED217]MAO42662.1 NAD(P)/FAD-dependent oxidoreductase [Leeuwenhoekiella sp.]MBQ53019.1 NAD(P)/FAD-dependent oxidoreductase [Leeuwenhoekiella sp.]HBT08608.1 NAD(P)/FAD-dependent oxidoreductase [Leeuwenhoekiella sp.]HCW64983.1 NAD(P)/FAD-dependent oxidoreductase [Leeuwenhoekiella sp.]|tara:strand:+ start:2423 stop:3691 length:1269 start_codon:yes stop_codon:yes gene_type:complete